MSAAQNTVDRWERYWSRINKTDTCWLWTGGTNSGGYGSMWFGGRLCGTHRLMLVWMGKLKTPIHTGSMATNVVLHSCDNPRCVNPAHLQLGTNTENQKEAYARARRAAERGATHTNAKLTPEQVEEIRRLYNSKTFVQIELAAMFGVSQRAISLVVRGETYV